MVRVKREINEQAVAVASHLPGVSAGAVIGEALTLQFLIVATMTELGHEDAPLDLSAKGLLTAYTNLVIARRLDVSALSARLAEGIEAEVEARAHALAEAAVPHHVAKALELLGVPADVAEDGQLNLGQPQPIAEA